MLTILSHLLKGEPMIQKYLKEKEETSASNKTATTSAQNKLNPVSNQIASSAQDTTTVTTPVPPPRPANPVAAESNAHSQFLDILVDMGFTRELAGDALAQTGYDVEQAAEWLLAHANIVRPPPVSRFFFVSFIFEGCTFSKTELILLYILIELRNVQIVFSWLNYSILTGF